MIVLILLLQLFISFNSLSIPHASGDQRAYVSLAMKLSEEGFNGYNLRHVGLKFNEGFIEYYRQAQEKGDLLNLMTKEGTPSYDQPIFYAPPAFASLIAVSHRVLANHKPFAALAPKGFQNPQVLSRATSVQLYACLIPILGGMLLVLGTYLLGRMLFSNGIALLGSFFIALSPVQMLASQRIWADTTLTAFCAFAFLFFYRWAESKRLLDMILAAMLFSLALLTKNTAVILIVPFTYVFFLGQSHDRESFKGSLRLILFFVMCLALTAPWYLTVTHYLGGPFNSLTGEGIPSDQPWFVFLRNRPWYTLFLGIIYQVPVFILGVIGALIAIPIVILRPKAEESHLGSFASLRMTSHDTFNAHILAVWFFTFLIFLTATTYQSDQPMGPEHRYMLPVYPAIALLAAHSIFKISEWFQQRELPGIGWSIAIFVSVVSVGWSILIFRYSMQMDIIATPF